MAMSNGIYMYVHDMYLENAGVRVTICTFLWFSAQKMRSQKRWKILHSLLYTALDLILRRLQLLARLQRQWNLNPDLVKKWLDIYENILELKCWLEPNLSVIVEQLLGKLSAIETYSWLDLIICVIYQYHTHDPSFIFWMIWRLTHLQYVAVTLVII